ncbi:MAG: hypothetical protein QOJ39_1481 [Candidatus Eremiobacteraeota bacterium]|nr:hypothetical protein [Candidatus Eremiobacteraeota bacterium]
MMPEYHSVLQSDQPDGSEVQRAAIAAVVLVAFFALFAFAKPHDPTKVVAGVPCSVLSEQDISACSEAKCA